MKLNEFLSTLKDTNVQVTLLDLQTGNEIVTFKASGYEVLDDSVEAREVKQWTISSATAIRVTIGEVTTTEP